MYADDILIFTKANHKSLRSIKAILIEFSLFTGLDINTAKSKETLSKVCEGNLDL